MRGHKCGAGVWGYRECVGGGVLIVVVVLVVAAMHHAVPNQPTYRLPGMTFS